MGCSRQHTSAVPGGQPGRLWIMLICQQVAVMFQIVCALALDVPEVLHELGRLKGVPPNFQLSCEPCPYEPSGRGLWMD